MLAKPERKWTTLNRKCVKEIAVTDRHVENGAKFKSINFELNLSNIFFYFSIFSFFIKIILFFFPLQISFKKYKLIKKFINCINLYMALERNI